MDQAAFGAVPVKKKSDGGCGCVVYGLIICVVVLVGGGIVAYFGAKSFLGGLVDEWSDEEPMLMPRVEISQAELEQLENRVDTFVNALENQQPSEPLVLTANDLNALIANDPAWQSTQGNVHVSIDGDQIRGKVSIPLEQLGFVGRHFNGSGAFTVSHTNGQLFVFIKSLSIKGQPLPDEITRELGRENLAKEAYKDAERAEMLDRITNIEVRDGAIHIEGVRG